MENDKLKPAVAGSLDRMVRSFPIDFRAIAAETGDYRSTAMGRSRNETVQRWAERLPIL